MAFYSIPQPGQSFSMGFACSGCRQIDRALESGRANCGGYPICPVCMFTVVPSKSQPTKTTCRSACPGWKPGQPTLPVGIRAFIAAAGIATQIPAPAPAIVHAEEESFDVLQAKLRERAESCLSSMAKLGHETPRHIVLNPYTKSALKITCGACGESGYIEQKRYVEGLPVHGAATGLDCKQMQRKKNP